MSGADLAMCLENRVLLRLELRDATWWAENFRVSVGLGLLLGRSGLPRSHETVDWGLRLLRGNFCGLGNGPDQKKKQQQQQQQAEYDQLILGFYWGYLTVELIPFDFTFQKFFNKI